MRTTYSIREATAADVPAIAGLAEAVWEPTYSLILSKEQLAYMLEAIYTREALLNQMREGQTFLLLYDEEDKPIGFAAYGMKDEAQKVYKLHKIYLLPGTQGRGLGKLLLTTVEEKVREKGAAILDLNVNRHNKAKDFYERCGYRVHQEEDIPIGPYWMNDYVMRKNL